MLVQSKYYDPNIEYVFKVCFGINLWRWEEILDFSYQAAASAQRIRH